MTLDRTDAPAAAAEHGTVFVAFELSKAKWQLGIVLPGSAKMSRFVIAGGDTAALTARLDWARAKAAGRQGRAVRLVSCYEAGYEGFWLHRWLVARGVVNHVLDPASIQVNRRLRRVKTDRLDLEQLMRVLLAHCRGEPRVCSVVRVPSVAEEDAKRVSRERQRLLQERGAHVNRIKALLHAQGVDEASPLRPDFAAHLEELRGPDGAPLPPHLGEELRREHRRLLLVAEQIAAIETAQGAAIKAAAPGTPAAKIAQLMQLKSLGQSGAPVLVDEVFYRAFDNRRQVGSYFGLTGTPFDSGERRREQGISKAGNARARTMAIELAWLWLRHQPDSALSRWYRDRVGTLKGRIRRITIVALARKLMVALWRYLETGLVPRGATLRAAG